MTSAPVRGIVFSKNRPLQLDATLRSFAHQCEDPERASISVLYRATSKVQENLYETLRREHPGVTFVRETVFMEDVRKILRGAEWILFLVDDTLFFRRFRLGTVLDALERQPKSIGFSLRLGRNTSYCYVFDYEQTVPPLAPVEEGVFRFAWGGSWGDFAFPLEVSSSVYRGSDLWPLIEVIPGWNPNSLEGYLAGAASCFALALPDLLCFETSVAFSAPLNNVKAALAGRCNQEKRNLPGQLAARFKTGERVDVQALDGFIPRGCHQEIDLVLHRP